ncbi:MAG: PadR family transcriptional regulator [Steroidobacteraceae bacterium]
MAQREMYGCETARALKVVSRGALSLGEGVLYPTLHSMEAHGLLRSRSQLADGRTRIYYGVTAPGRRRLDRLKSGWRQITDGVERILGAPNHE